MKAIKQQVKEAMVVGITSVLDGRTEIFKGDCIPAAMADEYLEKEGWERGDMVTNGWQSDRWVPYTKGDKSYTVFVSEFYGTFKFQKTKE